MNYNYRPQCVGPQVMGGWVNLVAGPSPRDEHVQGGGAEGGCMSMWGWVCLGEVWASARSTDT